MRNTTVEIPIYQKRLHIVKMACLSNLSATYAEAVGVEAYGAVTFRHKGDYVVAFEEESISGSLIAHETVHIVNAIYEDIRAQLDTVNDEPQAYLTGWLFEKIENALR